MTTLNTLAPLRRHGPFAEFDTLVRQAFGSGRTGWFDDANRPLTFVPAAEVHRDGDDAVVALELPGIDAEKDVTVEVDHDRLVVRGERRSERVRDASGESAASVREIRYGSFRREFGLPAHVADDAVNASYDAGILRIRVAGAYATTQPRRITVTASRPETSEQTPQPVPAGDAEQE